jgi:prepilin-type N-terminal cleavage/methylation domain-containing protein
MKHVKQSFTLVEILVVIVIIGILSSFIFFTINDSVEKANIAKSKMFSESIRNNLLLNLVSEWKLDGDTTDSWGSNNGTWYGAGGTITSETYLSESECVSGQCMDFDGTDDYINCGINTELDLLKKFSISIWFNPDSGGTTTFRALLRKALSNTQGWGVTFYDSDNHIIFWVSDGTALNYELYTSSVVDSKWNYLTIVKDNYGSDNGELYFYINGKEEISHNNIIDHVECDNPFKIGWTGDGWNKFFNGKIDEIQIYNTAISETAIKQNYLSGLNNLYAKGLISEIEYNQLSEK